MATSSFDSIFSLYTQRVTVPLGATNLVLVDGNAIAGANSVLIKMVSGGTLEILGVTTGVTLSAAAGASAQAAGGGFPMDTSTLIPISGPVRFYMAATGATCVAQLMWGRSQGT